MLYVYRTWETTKSTCGILAFDAVNFCYTLEPPVGPLRIPAAIYEVEFWPSPKFERVMPHLLNVPGWPNQDVEMHFGNYPGETEGCIMLGYSHAEDFIGNSQRAFADFMTKVNGESFQITVVDGPAPTDEISINQ